MNFMAFPLFVRSVLATVLTPARGNDALASRGRKSTQGMMAGITLGVDGM
jgi:hypothetical protein